MKYSDAEHLRDLLKGYIVVLDFVKNNNHYYCFYWQGRLLFDADMSDGIAILGIIEKIKSHDQFKRDICLFACIENTFKDFPKCIPKNILTIKDEYLNKIYNQINDQYKQI